MVNTTLAFANQGSASGSIAGSSFDVPITCNLPIGTKALPTLFSFKTISNNTGSGKPSGGVIFSGESLNGRIMYIFKDETISKRILSKSFRINDGILHDSNTVKNELTKTSYAYNFVIKCS